MQKFISPLTKQAIIYTWRQLIQRAGITDGDPNDTRVESLNIFLFYGQPEDFAGTEPALIIIPAPTRAWSKRLTLPENSLIWLPAAQVMPHGLALPLEKSLPILFWGQGYEDGQKPFAEHLDNGSIIFYADIIAATFFMLSRWEETVIQERDQHDRFPATASVAYKQGFLDRPIVDEYALILREWLKVLLPTWEPTPNQFKIKLSHDIDHISHFPTIAKASRTFMGDLVKRHNFTLARQTIQDWWQQTFTPINTPHIQNIYHLGQLSKKYGLQSVFYFMATDPTAYDNGYNPASLVVRQCIEDLLKQGHEIGFHPGYYTFNNSEQLAMEKNRLDQVLGKIAYGGRQHYLRFQVPDTWRHWEQVGLTYDSTVGYADHEGFRCGTCFPFKPFDLQENRELDILECPLIVMDTTLHAYRQFSLKEGLNCILDYAQRCKAVGGEFTLLWHNYTSANSCKWQPTSALYTQIVKELAIIGSDK